MDKKLIVMRGLPWTGKSYRAKQILDENEGAGLIFSTDEYWHIVEKPDKPEEYSFNRRKLHLAHHWNQQRTFRAIEQGQPLIIIDNTNTTISEIRPYAEYANWQDYKICIEEPTSDRWTEIRPLLSSKKANKAELKRWAERLAEGSKETHNVPAFAIERMMWRWEADVSIDKVLAV